MTAVVSHLALHMESYIGLHSIRTLHTGVQPFDTRQSNAASRH